MSVRLLKAAILGSLLSSFLCATDFSNYRGFVFGADIATVAKQAGQKPTDAKAVYTRPTVIQELEWQPRYTLATDLSKSGPPAIDPIKEGVLCFLDGKLYRIVITYDRYRIEGMTADDVVQAISQTYGPATTPIAEIPYHSNYAEAAKVLARWENAQFAYDLIRTWDDSSFVLVLYSKEQDALARASIIEAKRLEVLEAPQRALDEEKKRVDMDRLALEKIRATNLPNFRP